jgi:hypothetical protein
MGEHFPYLVTLIQSKQAENFVSWTFKLLYDFDRTVHTEIKELQS